MLRGRGNARREIVGRDDDLRFQTLDDLVALRVAQDVLGPVDRQSQHIDVAPAVPHVLRWIVAVVTPNQNAYAPGFNDIADIVEVTWVVWRIGVGAGFLDGVNPLVPAGSVGRVLVGRCSDRDVGEAPCAREPIQGRARLDPIRGVMVEMSVCR